MDIISRKYINEGFNSKAYIINDDYILLDGVNQNSYKNYQKYVNVINQISNVKSLEIPRIIELIEPCEEYPNGALIYKMIKTLNAKYPARCSKLFKYPEIRTKILQ